MTEIMPANSKPSSNKPMKDPPRMAALAALRAIRHDATALQDALGATRSRLKETRDRAFHHQLVMTTIRHGGEIEAVLKVFLQRKPKGRAEIIIDILHLGIAQVLYLDVPVYAATSTTVDLVRHSGLAGHVKLVNAIMRRVVEKGSGVLEKLDAPRLNTPDWLWHNWSAAYGMETCRAIAQANACEPDLDLSLKEINQGPDWAEKLAGNVLPNGSVRLNSGGQIEALDGYKEGLWWVQDAAATLPVTLLGDVSGLSVVDLCAAPGGKTMQLASAGAIVSALDRSKKRLKVLHRNLYRTHLKARVIHADALTWNPDELFDGVLLDAPCSATGTLRRHPDIALHKSQQDIISLTALQDDLIDAACKMVKPGGLLIYCTCSLQPEEGPERISAALERGLPLEIIPPTPNEFPGLSHAITPEGALRTLPSHWPEYGGLDGFYAVRLKKSV